MHWKDKTKVLFFFAEHSTKQTNQNDEDESTENVTKSLSNSHQIGSGDEIKNIDQIGQGESSSRQKLSDDDFVNKIAYLVTKKIYPRLPEQSWTNFNLTLPNSSMVES